MPGRMAVVLTKVGICIVESSNYLPPPNFRDVVPYNESEHGKAFFNDSTFIVCASEES
jgi:hypothetical protein